MTARWRAILLLTVGAFYDANFEFWASRKVTFTAYVGHAQGLAVMEQIYPPGKDANFGYLELFYRF